MEEMLVSTYDWENKVVIGQGSYSVVYRVRHRDRDELFAVKQLKTKGQTCQQFLRNELECLRKIKHQNVVKLYSQFQNEDFSWEVLEFCESNLRKLVQNTGSHAHIPEKEVISIVRQVVDAMLQLHKHNLVHRDLKPENILIKNKVVKLCDFGLAVYTTQNCTFHSYCGTPLYMSPQVATEGLYSSKADVWSLGIIFYEMLCGTAPWEFTQNTNYKNHIRDHPLQFPPGVLISQVSRDFIEKCLQYSEKDRMGWEEVAAHPLINMGNRVISQIQVQEANQLMERLSNAYNKDPKWLQNVYFTQSYQNSINMLEFLKTTRKVLSSKDVTPRQSRLLFQKMDANKNGKVASEEFKRILAKLSNSSSIISSIKETVFKCRLNKHIFLRAGIPESVEFLSYNQFESVIKLMDPSITQTEVKKLFERLDKDEDYRISRTEIQVLFELEEGPLQHIKTSKSVEKVAHVSSNSRLEKSRGGVSPINRHQRTTPNISKM